MITQQRDDPGGTHPLCASLFQREYQCCYAEVPAGSLDEQSQLIEQVMRFALDTLGARHLDVRVLAALDTSRERKWHHLNARYQEE
jgi:hypothetical protein